MLDADLAAFYGVSTGRFNEAVRRNLARFPVDFMFQWTNQDLAALRSQFAILKPRRGQHRKYPPCAFTEHGAIMAATILNSPRVAEVSVYAVRAEIAFASGEILRLRRGYSEGDEQSIGEAALRHAPG